MVKSDKGQVCIKVNIADIGADIVCLITAYKNELLEAGVPKNEAEGLIKKMVNIALSYLTHDEKKHSDEDTDIIERFLNMLKEL